MKFRCWARCSGRLKSVVEVKKYPTRESRSRGIIGWSGSFTIDQWTTNDLVTGGVPGAGGEGGNPGRNDCGVGCAAMVSVASTSMFLG